MILLTSKIIFLIQSTIISPLIILLNVYTAVIININAIVNNIINFVILNINTIIILVTVMFNIRY